MSEAYCVVLTRTSTNRPLVKGVAGRARQQDNDMTQTQTQTTATTTTTVRDGLYAHVTREEDGQWSLSVGRDVPGERSHGAAIPVGLFPTEGEARAEAVVRGVSADRIYT
jgi:hypothetical protein